MRGLTNYLNVLYPFLLPLIFDYAIDCYIYIQ